MLIVYDDQGVISQLVATGEFEALAVRYQEVGMHTLMIDHFVDLSAYYVNTDTKEVKSRPPMELQQEGKVVSGLPVGCRVTLWLGEVQVGTVKVRDGELEFDPEVLGTYRAQFDCWPYMTATMDLVR